MQSFKNHREVRKLAQETYIQENLHPIPEACFYTDICRTFISINGILLDPEEILDPSAKGKALFAALFKETNLSLSQKEYYESFIKLFVHQLYTNLASATCYKKFIDAGLYGPDFCIHPEYHVDLKLLNETNLYLTSSFSFFEKTSYEKLSEIKINNETFILEGETTFKIEVEPYSGQKGWVAKWGIVDSSIRCKDEYKSILDTRSVLEKFLDFITSIIENVMQATHPDRLEKSRIKSKPLFFFSKDGKSLEANPITNPSKEVLKKFSR